MAHERSPQAAAPLDGAAFSRLFDECLPVVYAYVGSRVDERRTAEEIAATAFLRAIDVANEAMFDAAAFRSFVFRVAASAVVDHARRSRGTYPRGVRASDFDRAIDPPRAAQVATDEIAARAFVAAIDRRAMREAIQRLPDPQRRLIVLRYLDCLSGDEQCAVLGWSRETLARRVHAALRAVHTALAEGAVDAA
jgi:RNA polymerase sigma factor (sigma-70 family)